jgi:predicted transcriptional regulator
MEKKRSKNQIIEEILTLCQEGASKTKIVYQVNLNFCTINPYLDSFTKNGLLDIFEGDPTKYKTMDKGMKVLKHLKAFDALVHKDKGHRI